MNFLQIQSVRCITHCGFLIFQFVSIGISFFFFLFFNEWVNRCFHTAGQECCYSNTAELVADRSSARARRRRNISVLQLILIRSRIAGVISPFLSRICRAPQPVWESSSSRNSPPLSAPLRNKTLLWHLEFEIACIRVHVENRLQSFFFVLTTFSPWFFWTEMPLRWTQSVGRVFHVWVWGFKWIRWSPPLPTSTCCCLRAFPPQWSSIACHLEKEKTKKQLSQSFQTLMQEQLSDAQEKNNVFKVKTMWPFSEHLQPWI